MKKYTKSYVIKEYSYGEVKYEEVEKRNPYDIQDDGIIHCFSFCDVSFIEDDGMIYSTKRYNYSNKVYFGTRYTLEEYAKLFGSRYPLLVRAFIESNVSNICLIRNDGGCVSLKDGDITYDELMNQKSKIK